MSLESQLVWILLLADFKEEEVSPTARPLQELTEALESLREAIAYKEEQLSDFALKKMHPKLKNEYLKMQAEEEELLKQRDILLSTPNNFGDLHRFASMWKNGVEGFNDKENAEAWQQEFHRVWNSLTLEHKRAMLKARFNPVVFAVDPKDKNRKRASTRIKFNAIGGVDPLPIHFKKTIFDAPWDSTEVSPGL